MTGLHLPALPRPFAGVRVLEVSAGIAGSYCGKMFADAGADVVKAEPAGGDPCGAGAPRGPGYRTAAAARCSAGQHNEEILTGILGLSAEEVRGLAERQVIGTRPAGLGGRAAAEPTRAVRKALSGRAAAEPTRALRKAP